VLRRIGLQAAGVSVVVLIAAASGWFGGADLARDLRRGFTVLSPVVVLSVAAAALVVGIAARCMPVGRRHRAVEWLGLSTGQLGSRRPPVSTVVALSAIVALAALFRVVLGEANHVPEVLGDELIYEGLAKGWALHGAPIFRGSLNVGYSTFYPLVLAPAFRFTADGEGALAAAKVINAISMALTAFPAFALSRRVVPRGWALGVAALSVIVPWTVYSSLVMTESLFYPVFVAYAAVLVWTLERPTTRRQAAMLGTLAVLVGVRAQGLTVALGTVAAILLYGALDSQGVVVALRRFRPTLAVFTALLALGIAAASFGVAVPTNSYNVVFGSLDQIGGMLKWAAWNLALFELSLGVVALAALPVAIRGMLRREASPIVRSTGVVAAGLTLSLVGSVALLSASPYGLQRLHERNLFYVTPLVLTCMAYWLWRGLERPFWLSAGCAAAAVTLVALLPERLVQSTNSIDVPSASFLLALDGRIPAVPFRAWVIIIAAVGAGTFLVARHPLFPILTVVLAFAAVTSRVDYRDYLTGAQARSLSWVDHALPPGTNANLVYLGGPHQLCARAAADQDNLTVWTEWFNTHIGGVEYIGNSNPADGLGAPQRLAVGHGGLILRNGRPFAPRYVVVNSRQQIVGTRLRRFDLSSLGRPYGSGPSLTLWRVDAPLRFEPLRPNAGGSVRGRGANLVPDGGFEAGVSGWTGNAGTEVITRTTAQHVAGSTAAMSVATAGSPSSGVYLTDPIPASEKMHYIFSFYVKGDAGQSVIPTLEWISKTVQTPTYDQSTATRLNGSWQLITLADSVPSGTKAMRPAIVLGGTPTTTFYVDSVRLVRGGSGVPAACWA
jgi:Carbohydrate binding domain